MTYFTSVVPHSLSDCKFLLKSFVSDETLNLATSLGVAVIAGVPFGYLSGCLSGLVVYLYAENSRLHMQTAATDTANKTLEKSNVIANEKLKLIKENKPVAPCITISHLHSTVLSLKEEKKELETRLITAMDQLAEKSTDSLLEYRAKLDIIEADLHLVKKENQSLKSEKDKLMTRTEFFLGVISRLKNENEKLTSEPNITNESI